MPDLPILRGSFVDGLTTSRVNWQGFYVGGQGGYGSSDEKFAGSNANMLATLLDHNVIQQMQVSQWNLGLAGQSARSSAYGAFAGYNWQWDDVVVGLEASYVHGSFGGASHATKELVSGSALSDTFFHDVAVDSSASISISDMATFRARAAYAWGCFLPYMFGGFALGKADIARSVTIHDAVSAIDKRAFHAAGDIERDGCGAQSPGLWLHGGPRRRRQSGRRVSSCVRSGNMSASHPRSTPTSIPCAPASVTSSEQRVCCLCQHGG